MAEVVPSSHLVQVILEFSLMKINKDQDQELDRHFKRYINNSKTILTEKTYQKIDKKMKSKINVSKVKSTYQKLYQQIKSLINGSKFRSKAI